MASGLARQKAAQAWCTDANQDKVMDPDLAEAFAEIIDQDRLELVGGKPTTELEKELSDLLNCHSRENNTDTPDWVLANYMMSCLCAFETAFKLRESWTGVTKTCES